MAVKDWCNEKMIAKSFVITHGPIYNYEEVLQHIKVYLDILSKRQKFLMNTARLLLNIPKEKKVASSFKDIYNKELEDFKIQQLKLMPSLKGYRNTIAVTVAEHNRFHQEVSLSTTNNFFNVSHTTQEAIDFTLKKL